MSGADELDEAIALANANSPARTGLPGAGPAGAVPAGTGHLEAEHPPPPRSEPVSGAAPREPEPIPRPGSTPRTEPRTEPWTDPWAEADTSRGPAARRDPGPGPSRDASPDDDFGPVLGLTPSRPAHDTGHAQGQPGTGHGAHADTAVYSWPDARIVASRTGRTLDTVTLPLDRALQHTLAEPLTALTDLPSFDSSAMDGWAVAGPGPWALEGDAEDPGVLAGARDEPQALADGHAVRIATGARIPPGASAVLRSEYGQVAHGRLRTARPPQPGTDIRPRGQECRSGDQLLPPGTPVTPALLGLAAAAGYDELTLVRKPRAEVLVLGDELLHRGLPRDGLIRDALGPMVGPWLTALGADVLVTRRLGDDAEALYEAVTTTRADLVVTTGGTASGPVDHLHHTLRSIGARLLVDGVQVRPGHPMLLAQLPGGAHLVGLPGNPLAALSGLITLAEPVLRTLTDRPAPPESRAPLADDVQGHPRDTRLVPVACAPGESMAHPLHYTGPAMLRGIATATDLAVIPPGGARRGTDVALLTLPW